MKCTQLKESCIILTKYLGRIYSASFNGNCKQASKQEPIIRFLLFRIMHKFGKVKVKGKAIPVTGRADL
jgi:hypothetical protein